MATIVPPTTPTQYRGPENCSACPGSRYCAPARCYCGHGECPAFLSFVALEDLPVPTVPTPRKKRAVKTAPSSWDDRTEETWIDQL